MEHVDVPICEGILQEMLRVTTSNGECVNMYDVRLRDSYPSCGMAWPPDLAQVQPYLRRADVIKALHIDADKKTGWVECNGQVSNNFRATESKPSKALLPGLLAQMPILLFSGDKDLICNHLGTEQLISSLEFNNGTGMETSPGVWAPKRDWEFEGEKVGLWQEARGLTYTLFYNSSHMVPFDFPRRAKGMVERFMGVRGAGGSEGSVDGGEKGSSNGTTTTPAEDEEKEAEQVQKATWRAYRQSGEAALVVVIVAAGVWAFIIFRARNRRREREGYRGVFGTDPDDDEAGAGGLGLDGVGGRERRSRRKAQQHRDVEAARDFDESELEDLTGRGEKVRPGAGRGMEEDHFGLGDGEDEEEEEGGGRGRGNGHVG